MIARAPKRCWACGETKPLDAFCRSKSAPDGFHSTCRKCDSARHKQYAQENKTKNHNRIDFPARKICSSCKADFPSSEFQKNASRPDGLAQYCRRCNAASNRASRYGLSRDEVRRIQETPCCQACGAAFQSERDKHFDHCHEGNHFRGVLCATCNKAASGPAAQCVTRLLNLASYLQRDLERQALEAPCLD